MTHNDSVIITSIITDVLKELKNISSQSTKNPRE